MLGVVPSCLGKTPERGIGTAEISCSTLQDRAPMPQGNTTAHQMETRKGCAQGPSTHSVHSQIPMYHILLDLAPCPALPSYKEWCWPAILFPQDEVLMTHSFSSGKRGSRKDGKSSLLPHRDPSAAWLCLILLTREPIKYHTMPEGFPLHSPLLKEVCITYKPEGNCAWTTSQSDVQFSQQTYDSCLQSSLVFIAILINLLTESCKVLQDNNLKSCRL